MALPTRAVSLPATALSATALSASALLLLVGCTAGPGATAPSSTPLPSSSSSADGGDDLDDVEATILDEGRLFAVVTWGSSTCIPQVDSVSASGQTVSVELIDSGDADAVCTADMAQRASIGGLPEGVDPTQEITLQVTYGDVTDDVDLDGDPSFTGSPGSSTEYTPSAGWFDDGSLVLLTWGSSSCPPIVEGVEGSGATGTVTFAADDRVCTMDMAPRATIISFGDDQVEDDDFTLNLVGDGLDGTVQVRG